MDNPDLLVACVIAASWHANKFVNPARDGVVLPILHLNGYKIANPTVLSRIGRDELEALLTGYGHRPWFVEGSEPGEMHQKMAAAVDGIVAELARVKGSHERPRWPMIVLRTPMRRKSLARSGTKRPMSSSRA